MCCYSRPYPSDHALSLCVALCYGCACCSYRKAQYEGSRTTWSTNRAGEITYAPRCFVDYAILSPFFVRHLVAWRNRSTFFVFPLAAEQRSSTADNFLCSPFAPTHSLLYDGHMNLRIEWCGLPQRDDPYVSIPEGLPPLRCVWGARA